MTLTVSSPSVSSTSLVSGQSAPSASQPVAAAQATSVSGAQQSTNATSPLLEDVENHKDPFQMDGQTFTVVSRYKRIKGKTAGENEALTSLEIHDSSGAAAYSEHFSYEFEKGEFTELCSASTELLSGSMKKWIFISSECLPDAPMSGGPWEILGVTNGKLVRWGKPLYTQGEFICFVPGKVSKVGSATSFGIDSLEIKVWTGNFFVTFPVAIALSEPKLVPGMRCYTQTGRGLGESGCQVPVEATRAPASEDTFVRLFPDPTDGGVPAHVIIRKDSKVEFISASVSFIFDDSGESINVGVRDDFWLKVQIDGKVGWIHTQEDFSAVGLPQSG
ncbi:MAG TPA: hypothetical protein VLV89_06515 [Candidatus Acidoferrum sp.]|nr:hypothetical protein [Candidatus Acidoferrum sp.]